MASESGKASAPVDAVVITPLEKPIAIDAIRCRLRQDLDHFGVRHSIPDGELRLILDIVDAARDCVREWKPSAIEKTRGAGTGVGMRASEDKLILVVKGDPRSS